jgi:hypothetical protein
MYQCGTPASSSTSSFNQIVCDLLLKSAFERIFNVMQLILVKIKGKYFIQKFHDILYMSLTIDFPSCITENE